MNRFDRITAILIQLQSKKVVKAQDLAHRFGISLRTVYRDIRSLEEAGVPVYGEAGIGYSLVDGYRLPPVMFTPEEAMAFITAGKLMEKFSDKTLTDNFASALYKVKAVLRNTEKDLVNNLEEHIDVIDTHNVTNAAATDSLDVLLRAVAEKKAVQMTYKAFGSDDVKSRIAEPIGIFHENDNWYTIAHCHLREMYRQFRLDRILSIKLTDITQQEHVNLKEYRKLYPKEWEKYPLEKVVLRVEKNSIPYIRERRHFYGFVSETIHGNMLEMTFLTQWAEEGLLRWFMMFADKGEILEPDWLREKAAVLIRSIIEKNDFKVSGQLQ